MNPRVGVDCLGKGKGILFTGCGEPQFASLGGAKGEKEREVFTVVKGCRGA
jgi:hypothetical protein